MAGDEAVELDDESTSRLAHRTGLLVRLRARMGLLPGDVSTAALLKARQIRRVWVIVAVGFVLVATAIPLLELTTGPIENSALVVSVLGPDDLPPGLGPYRVVLADGATVDLDADPDLAPGLPIDIRGSSNAPDGLVIDGEFVPAQSYSEPNYVTPFVIMTLIGLAFLAWLVPNFVWSRRTYRQIRDDLHAPTERVEGTYVGSWIWRGLINRAAFSAGLSPFGGIPIAIEHRESELTWYCAPISVLQDLVAFENHLRDHGPAVIVTFHPSTKALAAIRSLDGRELEIDPPVDALSPDAGLALNFSRRARRKHVPDR